MQAVSKILLGRSFILNESSAKKNLRLGPLSIFLLYSLGLILFHTYFDDLWCRFTVIDSVLHYVEQGGKGKKPMLQVEAQEAIDLMASVPKFIPDVMTSYQKVCLVIINNVVQYSF